MRGRTRKYEPTTVKAAYKGAPFHAKVVKYDHHITDEDRLRQKRAELKSSKELWREVVSQLDKVQVANPDAEPSYILDELGKECAIMVKAHTVLGAKRI